MSKGWKRATPVIAVLLVVVLIINTIWVSSAQVSIRRIEEDNPQGTANNYLIDNTSYMTQDTFQRMYEVLALYQTPTTWQGYQEQSGIYIARENYSKAAECMEKAIGLAEEASNQEIAQLWLQLGCLHTLLEEYDKTLEALEQCVTYNPENSESYLIMAQIYAEREDEENTLMNMEAYLKLNPGNADAEEMVAQLYMSKEDFETAKKWLMAAEESGGGAEVYYQYALCALQTTSYEEAEEHLSKALELDENVGDAYYYRAICRLMSEDYKEALSDLKNAATRTEDVAIQEEIQTLIEQLEMM